MAVTRGDGLEVTHAFPDGGHGSLRMQAVAVPSAFLTPSLVDGRWLADEGPLEAVVNTGALAALAPLRVGDELRVNVLGRAVALHVRGIVREHLAGAAVYVSTATYERALGEAGVTGGLRVGLRASAGSGAGGAVKEGVVTNERESAVAIEAALERAGFAVADMTTRVQVERALSGHLAMLIGIVGVMSAAMALVGVLGLSSAVGTRVLARTRELGVMRALGASDGCIRHSVLLEGVFIALLSVVVAAVLSVPLTAGLVSVVGPATLGTPGANAVSAVAVPLWLAVVLAAGAAASVAPARRALRITVREALIYQ